GATRQAQYRGRRARCGASQEKRRPGHRHRGKRRYRSGQIGQCGEEKAAAEGGDDRQARGRAGAVTVRTARFHSALINGAPVRSWKASKLRPGAISRTAKASPVTSSTARLV